MELRHEENSESDGFVSEEALIGGLVAQDHPVNYPMHVFGRPADSYFYLVSQHSLSPTENENVIQSAMDYLERTSEDIDPARFFDVGDKFFLGIQKYSWKEAEFPEMGLQKTIHDSSGWSKFYSAKTTPDADFDVSIYVEGVTEIGNYVIVVGSTK
jgi:hypothetical protein